MTKKLTPRERFAAAAARIPATWNLDRSETEAAANLHLYGPIGGWWGGIDAAELVPAIRDLDVATLNVYVNSPGGDVYDGIAIRNALRSHPARVVVTVDGLAASAASFIAVAGDEVIMAENAELMVHDAWNIAVGNADELRVAADELDRISDNLAAMYAAKAGGDAAEWRAIMRAETWYSAAEAVAAGLADRTDSDAGSEESPANLFDLSMYAHAGRLAASAPIPAAALATNRKEPTVNRAQLAAALAAGTITQEQHENALAVLDLQDAAASAQPADLQAAAAADPAIAAGPTAPTRAAHERVETRERPMSLRQASTRIAAAVNSGTRGAVQAALADVIPADDAGAAFMRDDWQGELWRAENITRPWIDAFGIPQPMTSLTGKGWRWDEEPDVDEYAGDKAEVPTNEVSTEGASFKGWRVAAGHDVDRALVDFGDPDFTASFLAARMRSYKRRSNAGVRTRLIALATAPTSPTVASGGVRAATKQVIRDVRAAGGKLNRLFLADDLFEELEDLPTDKLPLWLKSAAIGLDIAEGSADIGTLHVLNDSALAAGQLVGFDNRAAIVRERTPIELQAENIPHGGIDFGFFSYLRLDDHDPRVIVKRTYAGGPAPLAVEAPEA